MISLRHYYLHFLAKLLSYLLFFPQVKKGWFKRSTTHLVLISFTWGQVVPLAPSYASYQEEARVIQRQGKRTQASDPTRSVKEVMQSVDEYLEKHRITRTPDATRSSEEVMQSIDKYFEKYRVTRTPSRQSSLQTPDNQLPTYQEEARVIQRQGKRTQASDAMRSSEEVIQSLEKSIESIGECLENNRVTLTPPRQSSLQTPDNQLPTIQLNLSNRSPHYYVLSALSSLDKKPVFATRTFNLNRPESLIFNHGEFDFSFSQEKGFEIRHLDRRYNYILNIAAPVYTERAVGINGFFDLQQALSYTCYQELWADRGLRLQTPHVTLLGEKSKLHSNSKIAIYSQLLQSETGVIKGSNVVLNTSQLEGQGRIKGSHVIFEEHLHPLERVKANKITWSLQEGRLITSPISSPSSFEVNVSPNAKKPLELHAKPQARGEFKVVAPTVWCKGDFFPLTHIEANNIKWEVNDGQIIDTPLITSSDLEIYAPRLTKALQIQADIRAQKGLRIFTFQPIIIGNSKGASARLYTEGIGSIYSPESLNLEHGEICSSSILYIDANLFQGHRGLLQAPSVLLSTSKQRLDKRFNIRAQSVRWTTPRAIPFSQIDAERITWSLDEGQILDQPLVTSSFLEIDLKRGATRPLELQAHIQANGLKITGPHVVCHDEFFPLTNIEADKITWALKEGGVINEALITKSFLEIAVNPRATRPLYIKDDIYAGAGYKISAPHVIWQGASIPFEEIESPKITWYFAEGTLITAPLVTSSFLKIVVDPKATQPLLHLQHPITAARGFKLTAPQLIWQMPTVPPFKQIKADYIGWALNDGLIIRTPILTSSFLEIVVESPTAKKPLQIQADITTDKGLKFDTPTNVSIGVENGVFAKVHTNGRFESTSAGFDLIHGGVSAAQAYVEALSGIFLGRLMKDPSRDLFATFYCHAQISSCHSLGSEVNTVRYKFLNQTLTNVYDGHHLLTLPVANVNGSYFEVKGLTEFKGPLYHRGRLNTEDWILDSPKDSICEAGDINIGKNFDLKGGANLYLRRYIGALDFIYYTYNGCRITNTPTYHQAGSDPATVNIYGKLSADPKSKIVNEASVFYWHQKSPRTRIETREFKASLFQKFIEGTAQERADLRNSPPIHWAGWRQARGPLFPTNSIAGIVHIPYALGFLAKTDNFANAQQVFMPAGSSDTSVVLPGNGTVIKGNFSAPAIFVPVEDRGCVLGSAEAFIVERPNPIQDLVPARFNLHTTFVAKNLRKQIAKAPNQFHFKFRENIWFDHEKAQQFYQEIQDQIVVQMPQLTFTRALNPSLFRLSPRFLLEGVRKKCQAVLKRGYVDDNRIIDDRFVQELHHNALLYLTENHFLNRGDFKKALTTPNSRIPLPTKPMIFYESITNEEGLEALVPKIFFPPAMIEEANGKKGSKIRANILAVLPQGWSYQQVINYFQGRPSQQHMLIEFCRSNPEMRPLLTAGTLAIQDRQEQARHLTLHAPAAGPVTLNGEFKVGVLPIIAEGKLTGHADIETRKALLVSLFDDVIIEAKKERVSFGQVGSYYEHIPIKARVAAQEIVAILAGKDVAFIGAETHSGLATYIEALASVYNLPVNLVYQQVQHLSGKYKGTITDTHIDPHSTVHTSKKIICKKAGDKIVSQAVQMEAEIGVFVAKNANKDHEAHRIHIHSEDIAEKGRHGHSTKNSQSNSSSSTSVGSNYNFPKGMISGSNHGNVSLTNPTMIVGEGQQQLTSVPQATPHAVIKADENEQQLDSFILPSEIERLLQMLGTTPKTIIWAPEGRFELLLGTNTFQSASVSTSSNIAWTRVKQNQESHVTYSHPQIQGPVEVYSKETLVQKVHGQALEYLKRITQHGPPIIEQILDEVHTSSTKKIQGPSQALGVVVAIAAGVATFGWGTPIAEAVGLAGSQAGIAMASAAVSSLSAQTAVGLLSHQGDVGRVLKDLTSKDALRSLAVSVAAAGLTQALGDRLGIHKPQPLEAKLMKTSDLFKAYLKVNLLKAGILVPLQTTIGRQDLGEAIRTGLKSVAVETLGSVGANRIGTAYDAKGKLNYLTHKASHGLLGGAMGTLLGDDPLKDATSGAMGAMVAEVFAEAFHEDPTKTGLRVLKQAKEEGRSLTQEEYWGAFQDELQKSQNIGKIGAALTALITGQDVGTAIFTASNAVENNFIVAAIPYVVGAAITVWSANDVYDTYQREGEEAALKRAGVEVATLAVGGAVTKSGFKIAGKFYPTAELAWSAYLAQSPKVAAVAESLSSAVSKTKEAIITSKVGKAIAKFDVAGDELVRKGANKVKGIFGKLTRDTGRESVIVTHLESEGPLLGSIINPSGTISDIIATQPLYPGSVISRSFERALTPKDLGLAGDTLKELKGFVKLENEIVTVRINRVQALEEHFGNPGHNPIRFIRNLREMAQETGANTLKIEGSIANDILLKISSKRFGAVTHGANETITIPLK